MVPLRKNHNYECSRKSTQLHLQFILRQPNGKAFDRSPAGSHGVRQ
jgi:hypothetical protein